MTRYIVASRRAGQARAMQTTLPAAERQRSIQFVENDQMVDKVAEARAIGYGPDIVVEPEMIRRLPRDPIVIDRLLPRRPRPDATAAQPSSPASTESVDVSVLNEGQGVADVKVTLVVTPRTVMNGITDGQGMTHFSSIPSLQSLSSVSTSPIRGFWTVVTTTPEQNTTLFLPTIAPDGPLAWWHRTLGLRAYDPARGQGIRVGLLDTGLGPNPCLMHAKVLGSLIDGHFDPDGGADVDIHGTAIAGLIAARSCAPEDLVGIAPGVEIYSIRVFKQDGNSNQADVAAGIDKLVDEFNVDLINLSLTSSEPSDLESDAIRSALERGTLCVCAAGNNAGKVLYPAAYPETVSVGALGLTGWGPPGSIASQMHPAERDQVSDSGLFLVPFSARGLSLDCCAPGLGIISTFPGDSTQQAWGEDSGTSLSTPLVVGALAAVLSASAEYRAAPRAQGRAEMARKILASICRNLGLDSQYQGRGVPTVE